MNSESLAASRPAVNQADSIPDEMSLGGRPRMPTAIRIVLAVGCPALFAATWPLWFGGSEFPVVPLVPIGSLVPVPVDPAASFLMVLGWLLLLLNSRHAVNSTRTRRGSAPLSNPVPWILTAACCSALLNQHRLQAWWVYLHLCLVLTLLPARFGDVSRNLVYLTGTVYLFAALSRITTSPSPGMAELLLQTGLRLIGLKQAAADPLFVGRASTLLSVAEGAVGLALMIPRSRRHAGLAAAGMHLTLALLLSPIGAGHHAGVIIWNLMMAALVPLAAGRSRSTDLPTRETEDPGSLSGKAVEMQGDADRVPPNGPVGLAALCRWCVPVGLLIWGVLGLIGVADNWPAWQLYSPRPETLKLEVHTDSVQRLPPSLRKHVEPPVPLSDFCVVRLDRWSLSETRTPIYPEDRFQFAVAAAATDAVPPEQIRWILDRPNSPDYWNRTVSSGDGTQLREAAGRVKAAD